MALDFLKSDKEALADWRKPKYVDPLPGAKKKVLDKLNSVIDSVKKDPSKNITRWYKTEDGKDSASVALNIGSVPLAGDTTGGPDEIATFDAVAWFKTAKAAIEKGEMDDIIRKAWEGRDQSNARTAQRGSSDVVREIKPELIHRRNVKRYGDKRAEELLDRNVQEKGWDKKAVLAAYKELPPLG